MLIEVSLYQSVAKVLFLHHWLLHVVVERLENSQENPVFSLALVSGKRSSLSTSFSVTLTVIIGLMH